MKLHWMLGCAVLVIGAVGWARVAHLRAASAIERAAAAEAQVAGYREASAMMDAHLTTVRRERDRWAATAAELGRLEGVDDALNPYERAVLDRVRRP